MSEQKKRTPTNRDVIPYLTRLIAGCLILMWGVINVVHNILNWRAFDSESSHWWVTICFVVATGLIPMLIGIRILTRATSNN